MAYEIEHEGGGRRAPRGSRGVKVLGGAVDGRATGGRHLAVDDEDVVYRTAGKREAGGWSFRAL